MKKILATIFVVWSSVLCNGQANPLNPAALDTLYIKRSEKLFFEAAIDSGNHLSFRQVAKNTDISNTISIKLSYVGAVGAMLEIVNPFGKQLYYKAELYSPDKKDYVETSTIPVDPNLSSFETWPFKIDKIRLTGFRLKETKN